MKKYEQFPIAPMRVRGVFGITWQIYKRGFGSMLLMALLYCGLVTIIDIVYSCVRLGDLTSQIGSMIDYGYGVSYALSANADVPLIGLLSLFLLTPLWTSGAFSEYNLRMQGEQSGPGRLLSLSGRALGRYYGAYWALILVGVLFAIVAAIGGGIVSIGAYFRAAGEGVVLTGIIAGLVVLLIGIVLSVLVSLTFPIVANEGKKGFGAIGRSFRLAGKRFWRLLGVYALTYLILIVGFLILSIPAVILFVIPIIQNTGNVVNNTVGMFVYIDALALFVALFVTPYLAAQKTVLYIDALARTAGAPVPPVQAADVLPDDETAGKGEDAGTQADDSAQRQETTAPETIFTENAGYSDSIPVQNNNTNTAEPDERDWPDEPPKEERT